MPGWSVWATAQNRVLPPEAKSYTVGDPSMALGLVRQSRGAAILPRIITANAGCEITATGLMLGWPYALVCLTARVRNRGLARLIGHLADKATQRT